MASQKLVYSLSPTCTDIIIIMMGPGADHATEKTSRVECSSEESDEVVTVDRLNHQPAADSAHTHYDPNRCIL